MKSRLAKRETKMLEVTTERSSGRKDVEERRRERGDREERRRSRSRDKGRRRSRSRSRGHRRQEKLALQKISGLIITNVIGGEAEAGVGGTDGTREVGAGGNEGGQRQENEN